MAPGHMMEAQGTGLTHSIKWKRHKWASPFPQSHCDQHSLAVGQRVSGQQDPALEASLGDMNEERSHQANPWCAGR